MTEALVTNNCADEALKLIQQQWASEEHRACLNTVIYSTVLKGFALARRIDKVFMVYKEMRTNNILCNSITYNTLLDACAKCNSMDRAGTLLEDMRSSGVGPSNYTLSILVKLLGHARRLNQAFSMVEDLSKKNGFRPNVQVYTCLTQACILNRRLEKALTLHDTMIADAGCWADEKFYGVLARGCLQLHSPFKAVEVVRAAYQLPGHNLATPPRQSRPVGVDMQALEDICAKLHAGGNEEQEAVASLKKDLAELRGVKVSEP